ncbi:FG-GAP-like repeat-containing protein [Streptomyces sp. AN091965]|uniref:FG-GAP-like repeat-containing protein n=1 Tax=Streptomyces sp. AN091965 TaxID=2927803 RepID=UPI001F60C43D|nr:FG-GAP-like repeat-containing protein [Streptomyces sp. AN091965]MCI3931320.1 FG-GAP-like repeat-containing protein [Streptomyces sp. AN091965]
MRRSLIAAVAAAAVAAPLMLTATGTASAAPRPPKAPVTDFNKDGYADLAISAAYGSAGGKQNAGYVAVVYGSKNGPDRAHPRIIDRTTPGVPGDAREDDLFGGELVTGDFNKDGYTDLVVGGHPMTKAVLLWGSAAGLTGTSGEVANGAYGNITAGDFDGDGNRDLVNEVYPAHDNDRATLTVSYGPFTAQGHPARKKAVRVPTEPGLLDLVAGDLNGDGVDDLVTNDGDEDGPFASRFWKGTRSGLSGTSAKALKPSRGGVVADVDGDGYGDFVTRAVSGDGEAQSDDAGTVRVDYGHKNGPAATRSVKITQDSAGVPGAGERGGSIPGGDGEYHRGDQFGAALGAADVNGDGYADIAVGVPGEDVKAGAAEAYDAGSVVLLKGAKSGLSGKGAQAFTQSTAGVPGVSETGDRFGSRVLLSDVNGDKKADLTVTAPEEDTTVQDVGAAWYLKGSGTGLTTSGGTSFGPAALGAPDERSYFGAWMGR